jgi:hypothetical protein
MGVANEFHTKTVDPWPNYHCGARGDYQPVLVEVPVHELLRTNQTASGRIEWSLPITRAIAVRRLPFQFLDQPCPGIVEAQRDVSPILK